MKTKKKIDFHRLCAESTKLGNTTSQHNAHTVQLSDTNQWNLKQMVSGEVVGGGATWMQSKTNDNFELLKMDDLWPISAATARTTCVSASEPRIFARIINWFYHLIQFICLRNASLEKHVHRWMGCILWIYNEFAKLVHDMRENGFGFCSASNRCECLRDNRQC